MSDLRIAVHRAARQFNGGIEALAAALSSLDNLVKAQLLRNQLVGNERHFLSLDRAEAIIDLCNSDELAQAAARQRGGVFLRLPDPGEHDREELLTKFNELYAYLGELSATFRSATEDDEVDAKERRRLEGVGQKIHSTVEELLALTFAVYGGEPEVVSWK
jgi:hypothetical protein